jgi:hypothetical protein
VIYALLNTTLQIVGYKNKIMTIHFLAPEDRSKWHPTWEKCFESWVQTKYNINVWTDEGIDKLLQEDDKEFYNEYLNKLDPIYKFDYVRYIILENYGGMYVDMDVELIDISFMDKIDSEKIYLMEGTGGTYIENSLIISPLDNVNKQFWQRIKMSAKTNIMKKIDQCANYYNVIWIVGPQLISKFFIREDPKRTYYDILAWEHFGNVDGTFNFTKHHQTSVYGLKNIIKL